MARGKKIAISGDLGSGKSVTSKYIAQKLGYKYLSTGEIQRQMAEERNISVLEMNKLADINSDIDKKIDETLVRLNDTDDNYVLDSRLAWHFVPGSLKVYLCTNKEITFNRILSDKKRRSEKYTSLESARKEIAERKMSENARFLAEYGINCGDLSNYNLIIETTSVMPDAIGDKIIELLEAGNATTTHGNHWVSPKFMFSTQSINGLTDGGYPSGHMVVCAYFKEYYFIIDGHKTVSDALKGNIQLLPVILVFPKEGSPVESEILEYLKNKDTKPAIADWENFHDFKYEIYPHAGATEKI